VVSADAWSCFMGKRLAFVVAALAGVVIVIILWELLRQDEPKYGGKRLNAWLADLDFGAPEPSHKAVEAVQAIRGIGTNSFPWLIKMLCADESLWRRAAIEFNSRQSLIPLPVLPASLIRARAIEGYTALGAAATDAVPGLIELLGSQSSPQVRAYAASALGRIGIGARAAIPALQKAVCDQNAEVSKSAILALANIQMWMNDTQRHEWRR
jgi:hypothetical protein